MGGTQPLAVQVLGSPNPVEDHAARPGLALCWYGKHLVNAASELGACDHVGQNAAECLVKVESAAREPLAGGDGNRQRVDGEIGGRGRNQAYLHWPLSVAIRPGAPRPARARGRP
jgi:hypothetical protein